MEKIYRITPKKRGKDIKWIVQRIADRKTCGKPFELKSEAEIFMFKLMAKAPVPAPSIADNQPQSKLKIIEAFKAFVDYKLDQAKPGARFNKTSAKAYKIEYDLRISKFMPDKYLSEFNILVMEDFLTKAHKAGYPYKTLKRSVRSIKTFIKRMAAIGNNQHIVWGNYGIYTHDGQTQKADIAKGVVQEGLFDSVLNTHRGRSFVFKQTRDKEVWFCYSETGNSGDGANKAFVFDYDTQVWHKRDIPQLLELTETELDGVIKIYGASPDDANIQILSTSVYTSGGYFIQGENHLGTTDFKQLTSYYPDAEAQVLLAVDGTVNIGDTPTYTNQTFNPATSYKLDKRVSGRYMNVKVTMSGAINPKLTTVSFDLRGTARR